MTATLTCPICEIACRLTNGAEIYPHRPDLFEKSIWKCDGCGGYVGCHPGTTNPLGTPAGAELRRARLILHHQMVDPIWKNAPACGAYQNVDRKGAAAIRRAARARVYHYLSSILDIPIEQTHVGMFTIQQCRAAWKALRGKSYLEIRAWAHDRRQAA